jgi:hypothetical protein
LTTSPAKYVELRRSYKLSSRPAPSDGPPDTVVTMAKSSVARTALPKARFFLDRAGRSHPARGSAFEYQLEATIVFARSLLHLLQTEYDKRPGWKPWWDTLAGDPAVEFFRRNRDFILKEGPIGQRTTQVASVHLSGSMGAFGQLSVRVIRARPWYRRTPRILWSDLYNRLTEPLREWGRRREAVRKRAEAMRQAWQAEQPTTVAANFYFNEPSNDPMLKNRPALEVLATYLDRLELIIEDAEKRFGL